MQNPAGWPFKWNLGRQHFYITLFVFQHFAKRNVVKFDLSTSKSESRWRCRTIFYSLTPTSLADTFMLLFNLALKANVRKSVSRGGLTVFYHVRLNTLELRPNNSVKTKTKQRQFCLRGHFFSDRNVALVRCGHMGRLLPINRFDWEFVLIL